MSKKQKTKSQIKREEDKLFKIIFHFYSIFQTDNQLKVLAYMYPCKRRICDFEEYLDPYPRRDIKKQLKLLISLGDVATEEVNPGSTRYYYYLTKNGKHRLKKILYGMKNYKIKKNKP